MCIKTRFDNILINKLITIDPLLGTPSTMLCWCPCRALPSLSSTWRTPQCKEQINNFTFEQINHDLIFSKYSSLLQMLMPKETKRGKIFKNKVVCFVLSPGPPSLLLRKKWALLFGNDHWCLKKISQFCLNEWMNRLFSLLKNYYEWEHIIRIFKNLLVFTFFVFR